MTNLYLVKSLLEPVSPNSIFIDFIERKVFFIKNGIKILIYNENEEFDLKKIAKKFKENRNA